MVKKEFTFKGKTLKELNEMTVQEFAKLCKSRAKKSLLKGFNKSIEKRMIKALELKKSGKQPKPIRTHRRDIVVIPKMVGLNFAVYNGKEFVIVNIIPEMLGHFLGEMVLTRKRLMHGKAGIGATRSSTAITARG